TIVLSRLSHLLCSSCSPSLFFLLLPRPPTSTLFPYTTLFRSFNSFFSAVRLAELARWALVRFDSVHFLVADRPSTHTLVATRKRSEEHTSELQSRSELVCRLLLEKKKIN